MLSESEKDLHRVEPIELEEFLDLLVPKVRRREEIWSDIINHFGFKEITEIGVFRGEFSASILENCKTIDRYHLVDPWKHQVSWNKPANVSDATFENIYTEMLANTSFAASKRVIHRGKSIDIIPDFAGTSQDFIYIDGDHTLRGITIDLQVSWPKLKMGGIIGGDDFTATIWQHNSNFEPSLIFPYTVYFAEAVGAVLYALPFEQFLLHKLDGGFRFIDFTGAYGNLDLRNQLLI